MRIDPVVLQMRGPSQDWVAERVNYLGATDIAAIMGVHPYKTPFQVYNEKKGLAAPPELNQAMVHGQNLEGYVAQCHKRITGRRLRKSRTYHMRGKPYLAATPDYEIIGEKRLLECKTAGHWAGQEFGDPESDQVPDQYLVQCMWQLAVTKRKGCDLAVLIGGQDFRLYRVERDEELIERLIATADAWWHEYILSDTPPPLTGDPPDTAWVNKANPIDSGDILWANPELDELCTQLQAAREAAKEAAREEARLANEIKMAMADAAVLKCSVGEITWKTNANGQRRFCPKFKEISHV